MCSEMPQTYGCKLRTARKQHECYECRGWIEKGEKYHYHHGVWEGKGESYKVCLDCEELRAEADKHATDSEEFTPFGGLHETVSLMCGQPLLGRFLEIARKRRKTSDSNAKNLSHDFLVDVWTNL